MVKTDGHAQQDAFEDFLVEMDFLLDDLQSLLDQSSGYSEVKVAFDDASLDRIEAFYLDVVAGREQVNIPEGRLNRIISAYLGEALRERTGGKWALDKDSTSSSYDSPVLLEWTTDAMPWSPFIARERLASRQKPFLKEFIDYAINKEELEKKLFE